MLFKKKEINYSYQIPGRQCIQEDSFFDNIDKICNSFVKIYKCKQFNDDLKAYEIEEASYNYLDLIFERCINFIIEMEKYKIINLSNDIEKSWKEFLNNNSNNNEKQEK